MSSCTTATRSLQMAALIAAVGCDRAPSLPSSTTTNSASPAQPWFAQEAQQRGLNFVWNSGHQERYFMPECIGGGGALFDMDNDGDLDIYLVQAGSLSHSDRNQPNMLLRNDGKGYFEQVTGPNAAGDRGYGMGAACGDYDNDGDVDLYVTNVGSNVLYQNDGHGAFTDVTTSIGVAGSGWSTSAAFLDYDNDSDLDLYVCEYVNWSISTEIDCFNTMGAPDYCSPNNYVAPAMDALYRNNGPDANYTFTDVTVEAGIDAWSGNGLGVVCGDFDRDGWIDIFVANDGMRNQLWTNQRDGTFIDLGLMSGCALDLEGRAKAGMGTHAADIDDDADLDIIVCNLKRESDSVFVNQGTHFSDETTRAGLRVLTRAFTRFGMGWIDFDNDGYLDLYQANGLVMREDTQYSDDPYTQPSLLFRGKPGAGGVFEEVQPRGGTAQPLVATSRAAAFGDIDNDGGIDILVINRDGPAHLLHNVIASASPPNALASDNPKSKIQIEDSTRRNPKSPHWLLLRIVEPLANGAMRDAYGATISMKLGQRTITRDVRAAYSYLASNDPRVHVGLGPHDKVDDVAIRWIDGTIESFGTLRANQIHTLKRGAGETFPSQ